MMQALLDIAAQVFVKHYKKHDTDEKYLPVKWSIGINILCDLYRLHVLHKMMTPIEEINQDEKKRYWKISLKYYKDPTERTLACKAAYMLDELGME